MTDRYTKAVLTVIAAALVILAAQNTVGASRAQTNELQKVQICGSGYKCLDLALTGNMGAALPVVPVR